MEERDVKKSCEEVSVGGTFEWCKLIYEVQESSSCKGCWFLDADCGCTVGFVNRGIPRCGGFLRKDGKDVIFVQVGEVQD